MYELYKRWHVLHCPATKGTMLQVLHTYCGTVHHILRPDEPNKNQGTKPSADKEHDPTLSPKQSGQEAWWNNGKKTTAINKISCQDWNKFIYLLDKYEKKNCFNNSDLTFEKNLQTLLHSEK